MPGQSTFFQNYLTFDKPDGYNPYALGAKHYGIMGGPQQGAMPAQSMVGYNKRDSEIRAKKRAYLERIQAMNSGNYGSAAALRSY